MKTILKSLALLTVIALVSCGGNKKEDKFGNPASDEKAATEVATTEEAPAFPLAEKGKDLYTKKGCTACHNPTMKIVGPAPKGIFERRNPAWVMNMIMDPEKMVKEDADAKALLEEYNNLPMTNQGVSEEEARAMVEYFRTL